MSSFPDNEDDSPEAIVARGEADEKKILAEARLAEARSKYHPLTQIILTITDFLSNITGGVLATIIIVALITGVVVFVRPEIITAATGLCR